ncbi:hypothetical protein [Verrucosispora sp. WMMC514]|uniref:hypothetical protein n=1 Tax=Verrucosispora sp. WMMC514 TaxID=3015156 RepID=UPI00248B759E|nr:hypothetical protein [Verrucosispora sp. WMMC514]WBB94165.1 hypothetical protein O7597_15050 [Verrucosispora sp. WMMC514]
MDTAPHRQPTTHHDAPAGRHRVDSRPVIVRHGLTGLAWLTLGAAAYTVGSSDPDGWGYSGTIALSALSAVFGCWVFWRDGGNRITAVGVYNLAFALFVGFAGLYLAVKAGSDNPGAPLFAAQAVCYFSHVTMWMLFWGTTVAPARRPHSPQVTVDGRTAGWAVTFGTALLAVAVTVALAAGHTTVLVMPAGFVGVLLLGVGLLLGPLGRRTLLCGAVLIAAFGIYFTYLFTGFGRIVIGTLALALLVVFAYRHTHRYAKTIIVGGAAPALLFLAALRAGGPGSTIDADGFGSAVSPFSSFAHLWQLDIWGYLPHAAGSTFWAAAVALVPRAMWPDKPVGFGSEIVPYLSPELAGTEHSAAALWHGEWLFNFGGWGLLVMIPVIGLAVRGIDRLLIRAAARPLTTPASLAGFVAAILAMVGLFDLLWVGSFTYMTRTGSRLVVLVLLLVAVGWMHRRHVEPDDSRDVRA